MADPLRGTQARLDSTEPLQWRELERDARWLVAEVSPLPNLVSRQELLHDANAVADVLSDEKEALFQQLSQCLSDGALNAHSEAATRACLCK